MVKEKQDGYICEECNFAYKDKEWAKKCEAWCKKYHSCNIDITKHAVQEIKK